MRRVGRYAITLAPLVLLVGCHANGRPASRVEPPDPPQDARILFPSRGVIAAPPPAGWRLTGDLHWRRITISPGQDNPYAYVSFEVPDAAVPEQGAQVLAADADHGTLAGERAARSLGRSWDKAPDGSPLYELTLARRVDERIVAFKAALLSAAEVPVVERIAAGLRLVPHALPHFVTFLNTDVGFVPPVGTWPIVGHGTREQRWRVAPGVTMRVDSSGVRSVDEAMADYGRLQEQRSADRRRPRWVRVVGSPRVVRGSACSEQQPDHGVSAARFLTAFVATRKGPLLVVFLSDDVTSAELERVADAVLKTVRHATPDDAVIWRPLPQGQ